MRSFGEVREGGFLRTFALSPDGRRLVAAYWAGTLKVWDVASGVEIAGVDPHPGIVGAIAISADGRTIASGSADGRRRCGMGLPSITRWSCRDTSPELAT